MVIEKSATYKSSALRLISGILWCSIIYSETPGSIIVERHDRRHVSTAITIIRRRPDGDQLLVEHVLVAFLHQLMCASDKGERIDVVELGECETGKERRRQGTNLFYDTSTEQPSRTPRADGPIVDVVGV